MRAKRYINLEDNELSTLKEGYKNVSHHQFKSRCHCLLLSNDGYDMATLKGIFGVSQACITNWFDNWEQKGLAGLYNQRGTGRKRILSDLDKEIVKTKVQECPQELKRAIIEIKAELNKEFSEKTLKRFLKKLVTPLGKGQEKR